MGVVEECAREGAFVHPLVVVPKPNGKVRVCLDCRRLNEQLEVDRVKLERLEDFLDIIPTKGFIATTDIENAYLQVPVRAEDRNALAFRMDGRTYRFRRMPFGVSTAPACFTRALRPLAGQWRRAGVTVLIYLDDIVVAAQTRAGCELAAARIRRDLQELGFALSKKKCTAPAQQATVLGVRIDTVKGTVSVPSEKRSNLRQWLRRAASWTRLGPRQARQLLGKLRALRLIVPAFRVRSMHLLTMVQRDRRMVTDALRVELHWWSKVGIETRRRWREDRRPQTRIETDASMSGWGAFCSTLDEVAHGQWTTRRHINTLELDAVRRAIQRWGSRLRGTELHIWTDNMTTFHYLRKQGGSRKGLNYLMGMIVELAETHDLRIRPHFVPGDENIIADRLSRLTGINRARLPVADFRKLQRRWGPFSVDLFADSRSACLPRALRFDRGEDALADEWPAGVAYAFPPPRLIPRFLQRVQRDRRCVVLVTPVWPTAIWWTEVSKATEQCRLTYARHGRWCYRAFRINYGASR